MDSPYGKGFRCLTAGSLSSSNRQEQREPTALIGVLMEAIRGLGIPFGAEGFRCFETRKGSHDMKNDKWLSRILWMGLLAGILIPQARAAGLEKGYALTVYNDDLVLVRDRRVFPVEKGTHLLRFEDIAQTLDATSVNIASLTDSKGFRVLEQNYEYDLVNQQKLLSRYIGQEIALLKFGADSQSRGEDLKVKLLSSDGNQMVVQKSDGSLLNVYSSQNVQFPKLPENLILKPSLTWLVKAATGGDQLLNLSYLASGMSWHADYTLLVDDAETKADLNAWVTLDNNTGTTFKDAKLKLLAGEVNRVQASPRPRMLYAAKAAMADEATEQAFTEKTFSEYHLYVLGRTTTLRNNETKQIELLSAPQVPVKKEYRYDGAGTGFGWGEGITDPHYGATSANKKVEVVLKIENEAASGLGQPLPAGKVRVYKQDEDGGQEFLGEDSIGHSPKDETVKVKMGNAFDLTGERKQTNFVNPKANNIEETFEITLKNHKKEAVTIRVIEHLYRYANWKIETMSHPFEKKDARTVEFAVKVPADGKATVSYTVKYGWK